MIPSYKILDNSYKMQIKKPNYNENPIPSNRMMILNSKIEKLYILCTPLHIFLNLIASMVTYKLANELYHAAVIVITDDDSCIKIEYGAYDDRRGGDYMAKVHYYNGRNGLRFMKLSDIDISTMLQTFGNILFECDFKKKMSIGELLKATNFSSNVIDCWNRENYDLFSHNCQLFVERVVDVMNATRKKGLINFKGYSISYNVSNIPHDIMEALKRNETFLTIIWSFFSKKYNFIYE